MQLALYRAERPEVFEDIIGQTHIVKILSNQLRSGTIGQSYLFSGTHGTGKTSTARIVAKALNCLDPVDGLPCGKCENCEAIRQGRFVDVIELDAASNNGVENIRSIIDLVKYPPTVGRYKVYIIDEVHMLSPSAENAFLKTLEEPPEYAMFILCTTDPQKINPTIRSRCMQLNFRRISEDELIRGLKRICQKKQVEIEDDALVLLSQKSDGSVRDALSLLEQTMAAGDKLLTRDLVLEYTGCAGDEFYIELTDAVARSDVQEALILIDKISREGKDAKQALKDWLSHYRNLMIGSYVKDSEKILGISGAKLDRLKNQAKTLSTKKISRAIMLLSEYINLAKFSDRPRIQFETAAVKLCDEEAFCIETMSSEPKRSSNSGNSFARERQANNLRQGFNGNRKEKSLATEANSEPPKKPEPAPTKFEPPVQDKETEYKNRQLAAASTSSGSADDVWNRIVSELKKRNDSLSSTGFLIKYAVPAKLENGELQIYIKNTKFELAKDSFKDANEIAKRLYGSSIYVVFRAGELPSKKEVPTSYSDFAMEKMTQEASLTEESSHTIDDLDTGLDDKIEADNEALADQTSDEQVVDKIKNDFHTLVGIEPEIVD